ncbi:MAG: hypothetical protein PHN78_03185 [Dehalococcoidales bacterium]|nr:hypothetical protein [Dehalococcoidales bacterium]
MIKRLGILIFITFVLGLVFPTTVALAQGLGLSGNFYKQHYELSPGQSSSDGDTYVVVTNPDDNPVRVKMITDAPAGVVIHLTQDDFSLVAGEQQKVNITIEASTQAIPGDYILTITAEAVREGTGIKVTAGTQQQAPLSVLGEGGQVTINTVNEEGEDFSLGINIFEKTGSDLTRVRSGQGTLVSRLKPGEYVTKALHQEIVLTEQAFSLADKENKEITLICPTVCVSDFTLTPNHSSDNKLISLKIGYTIINLQKPLPDVKAVLKVKLDDHDLDETELTSFSQMDVGSRSGTYNYSPAQGWQQEHKYSFIVELYSKDNLRYRSQQQDLVAGVVVPSSVPAVSPQGTEEILPPQDNTNNLFSAVNWVLVGSIIGGVVIITVIVILLIRRRSLY